MDLQVLKSHIKSGKLNDYYIFTGTEVEVMRIYLHQMSKSVNKPIKNLDRITELVQKLNARSPFQSAFIYVLREDKDFLCDDKFQAKISALNANLDTVIFIYSNIDKRSKFFKNFQNSIVEFLPLRSDILIKYIQREIMLSDDNCEQLINICGGDYGRIRLEIDKLHRFILKEKKNADDAFEKLIRDGTIYVPPKDAVFDFIDAVLDFRCQDAFRLLQECFEYGESSFVIISNLYTSAKRVLQVQSFVGKDVCASTGLTSFQVKLANKHRNNYSNSDLVYLLKLVREVERGVKCGEIDENISIPYILTNFWS